MSFGGKQSLVLIFSQTFPIYPYGSARNDSKLKKTVVENKSVGIKRDVDEIFLKQFFQKFYNKKADVFVKQNLSFEETTEEIRKGIQSDKEYDSYFIIFLTFVDDQNRLQFNEPTFEQGLQRIDVFVNLVMDFEKEINGKRVIFLIQADDLSLLETKTYKAVGYESDERSSIQSSKLGFILIMSTIPQKIAEEENESFLVRAFVEVMKNNLAKSEKEQNEMSILAQDIENQVMLMVVECKNPRACDMPRLFVCDFSNQQ